MQAIELGSDANPMIDETDAILEQMKDHGFLIGKTGLNRNVLTVMPPLVVSDDDLTALCDRLQQVMGDICGWA